MPKYELYYIVAGVSDNEIPGVIGQVQSAVESAGGKIVSHEDEGRKKFAYPINKARNGNYVLMRFEGEPKKIQDIENAIKTINPIVRYLILNIDDALIRMAKDQKAKSQMKKPAPEKQRDSKPEEAPKKKIDIDLDAEIEKALEPEELK